MGTLVALLSLALLYTAISAPGVTTLSVEPSSIAKYLNNDFTVDINVTDVTDLYSFQLNITWNNAILNCTGDLLNQTMDDLWGPNNWFAWPMGEGERINNTVGQYTMMVSALDPAIPFNGSATLDILNFTAISIGSTEIGFIYETILGNSTADEIPHTQVNGTVTIRIPGDVNGDGVVDVQDLYLLGRAYGSTPGSPNWLALADINGDETVGIDDLLLLDENYGKTT